MTDYNLIFSPAQCRAARGLANLSQTQVAELAHLTAATISEYERGSGTPFYNNLKAIGEVLEGAGIEFLPENSGGLGVRLRVKKGKRVSDERTFTPDLCRAGRGLLGLSQTNLVDASGVSRSTITEFERGARTPGDEILTTLRKALETAGVVFLFPADGGPGVRLRKCASRPFRFK